MGLLVFLLTVGYTNQKKCIPEYQSISFGVDNSSKLKCIDKQEFDYSTIFVTLITICTADIQ